MASLRVLFLATRDWYHPATTGGDITMWENARYLAHAGHQVKVTGELKDSTITVSKIEM